MHVKPRRRGAAAVVWPALRPPFIIRAMSPALPDIAAIRLDNALLLFDEFVQQTARQADAAALRGLEGRFAEKLGIAPSYWSQVKSRSRQIGERLARQFELLSHKPRGWMDIVHTHPSSSQQVNLSAGESISTLMSNSLQPQNDEERFLVTLLLSYYRTHPQRARTRLLDLLGDVLTPPAPATPALPRAPAPTPDDATPWVQATRHVAPLKRKR